MAATWQSFIKTEGTKPYFQTLKHRLGQRYQVATVYPAKDKVMNAFRLTPFDQVRVVILGQDPYHGEGQAMGLSFSVPDGVEVPPSLQNIYKEIKISVGVDCNPSGNLERWAKQGVLLLNSVLTVEKDKAGSHADLNWQMFTDNAIKKLNEEKTGVVFMLWGNYARQKSNLIDEKKHAILEAAHPSPLSAHKGFFGCDHFHAANVYLTLVYGTQIDWR